MIFINAFPLLWFTKCENIITARYHALLFKIFKGDDKNFGTKQQNQPADQVFQYKG